MENNPVRIHSNRSPNPAKQKNYTVICHSHRVFTIVTAKPTLVHKWIHRICNRHRHQLRRGRLVVASESSGLSGLATLPPPSKSAWATAVSYFSSNTPTTPPPDGDMLWDSRHHLEICRLVDMRAVASDLRGCSRNISMERLADEILGMEGVEKKEYVGRSDWDQEWLSEEQVKYACVDAFLSFLMAIELQVWDWGWFMFWLYVDGISALSRAFERIKLEQYHS
ncbi:hypothetical protein DH2020_006431 [Rehmannia glutinosa]|uniref:3'-5' exonuclease domain-containing protein n=1 Tax=Rehmannia glutinosa TaxID=99300 RepID=A0ABR0XIW9_REHGL